MAGSWDFTADSEIQTELSKSLNEAADNYDAKVAELYSEIESLGSNSYWVGEDYDAFKTGTEGYKTALQDLSDGIRMFGKHFELMSQGTDTLASELISIIQTMTGSSSGGATGGSTGENGGTSGTSPNVGTAPSTSGGTGGSSSSSEDEDNTSSTGGTATADASGEDQSVDDATGERELSTNYFIQRGDKCTVYGEEVTFFGRDGSYNYYTDANGNVFVDGDGRLISLDVHQNNFNIGYLKDGSAWYGAVTTTSGNATTMNLPEEITDSSNSNFDVYGMQEYVDPSSISTENYSTYDTNEGFRQDLNSANPPKVLEFDYALESPLWDPIQPDINPGSNGKVTLVYDERAGMYYQLDDNGTYVRGMYGYTPEELSEYDVEKHK